MIKVEAGPYTIDATDGNLEAWTRLYNAGQGRSRPPTPPTSKLQGNNPDGTPQPRLRDLLDADNLIDYMLVILYGGNLDAPISNFLGNTSPNNWYGIRNRIGRRRLPLLRPRRRAHPARIVNENRTGPLPAPATARRHLRAARSGSGSSSGPTPSSGSAWPTASTATSSTAAR